MIYLKLTIKLQLTYELILIINMKLIYDLFEVVVSRNLSYEKYCNYLSPRVFGTCKKY